MNSTHYGVFETIQALFNLSEVLLYYCYTRIFIFCIDKKTNFISDWPVLFVSSFKIM